MKGTLGALATAMAVAVAGCTQAPTGQGGPPPGCVLDLPDTIGGPVSLVDGAGAAVTEAAFAGRPALVYFGFAYCPDVCPASLQTAKATLEVLGPAGADIQPILISLDPERDTPAALATYVASPAFPANTIGLTGTPEQTAAAAKTFRVAWRRNETPASASGYLIDHASNFYLMDAEWRAMALFPSTLAPKEAARCIAMAMKSTGEG